MNKIENNKMISEIGNDEVVKSRREALGAILGLGIGGIVLSSCSASSVGGTAAAIGAAAVVARATGNRDAAEQMERVAAILALVAIVLYIYQASQKQKNDVLQRKAKIDADAARNAPKDRYVGVKTSKPTHQPKKQKTQKGRELEQAQSEATGIAKTAKPKTEHVMIYDTKRKNLKNSTVYEVSNPKKGQPVNLAGTTVPYRG